MVYKRYMSRFLLPLAAVLLLFSSCTGLQESTASASAPIREKQEKPAPSGEADSAADQKGVAVKPELPATAEDEKKPESAPDPLAAYLDRMDIKRQIGQLFLVEVRHPETGQLITRMNEAFREWAADLQPGGYILFADNLRNPQQTRELIADLQSLTTIPPFIALDEEGGVVSRLTAVPAMGGIPVPSARVIGASGYTAKAREAARTIAKQLRDLGFSVNFAPVADIHIPGTGGTMGERSYGTEAQLVSRMACAFSKTLEDEGILSVAKHFPGHGAAYGDSHTEKTVLDASREILTRREMLPFSALIKQGIGGIMTGHIIVPSLDNSGKPASLSGIISRNLLRDEMDYNGLVFTDSLRMGGVTAFYNAVELPLLAFEAGADILLMPVAALESRQRLLEALETGRIPQQRLRESLNRIALAKRRFLSPDGITPSP
ncbi:glycoside hydrolase family 3 N-terminal domain-containing protein [Marispirochaeta aestuarii]|uniref:glycoside hydrolase family 3 N-terminal domain-containing protein n=1 Tax=Marispirochaeta aestuarii TaxID=1963862 RepID=UPI0029C728F4|nr:glycoside hydrolase family 3 N-terminal domain-containing protein [Marispirochaeta aestuarii]